jgi:hypothetical protein
MEVDKVHEDHVEEGAYLIHNESQEWFYLSRQTRDEATVFITWDEDGGTILSTYTHNQLPPQWYLDICDRYPASWCFHKLWRA